MMIAKKTKPRKPRASFVPSCDQCGKRNPLHVVFYCAGQCGATVCIECLRSVTGELEAKAARVEKLTREIACPRCGTVHLDACP